MATRQAAGYSEDVLVPSTSRTSAGDSGLWDDSPDGSTWYQVGAFTAKPAVGTEAIDVTTPFANRLRIRWNITGTNPNFTFSVAAVSQGANW